MSSSSSASTVVPSLLLSSFPSVDKPVLDYFTAILLDLLPIVHTPASLSAHFADILLNQEVVDSQSEADAACASLFSSLLSASLVKAKAQKSAPSPTSAPPKPSTLQEEKEIPNSDLPYDPFVTVQVAQTSRKARKAHPTGPPQPSTSQRQAVPELAASVEVEEVEKLDIDIGYACDALYPSDSHYYPAIITAIQSPDRIQVLYLDYGNYEWLSRSQLQNVRDAADDVEEETRPKNEVRVLAKAVRIGDAEEQEREKREKRRAERKAEAERRELERGGMNLKISRKKLIERERKREEEEKKRQWDETKRKEEMAAALPIHLKAVEMMRRDKSKKWERDVFIPELTLLAPDNAVLLQATEFRLVAGRRYGLVGRNGIGKCWGAGTKMMLYATGECKNVEEIVAGDVLMGDDSTPRVVLPGSVYSGVGRMFQVKSKNPGRENWTCNEDHILVLKCNTKPRVKKMHHGWCIAYWTTSAGTTPDSCIPMQVLVRENGVVKYFADEDEAGRYLDGFIEGWTPLVFECTVRDYLAMSQSTRQQLMMYQPDWVNFRQHGESLEQRMRTIWGREMADWEVLETAWVLGTWLTKGPDTGLLSGGQNSPSLQLLDSYGILGKKHIPNSLLTERRAVRRALLAGIIDGDGHFRQQSNLYEIYAEKSPLMDGIIHLCRGLGFSVGMKEHTIIHGKERVAFTGFRVSVGGNDLSELAPLLACPFKRCPYSAEYGGDLNKDQCCDGFTISEIEGGGRYYGFTLSGNGRCLLSDFVVTHNTTLLRQLSAYKISGFPAYLKVQHVEQEITGDDVPVIESVLNADIERRLLVEEEKRLTAEKKAEGKDQKEGGGGGEAEDRLSDIYQRLNDIDAWTAEARASVICAGLGFTPDMQKMKTKDLSGGWRMRVSLASALLVNPDILLLDEPTNHLDFPAVLWLTNYLSTQFTKTLIVVSHDRTFLNDVITDVVYFSNRQSLEYYRGDYNNFVKVKAANYIADKRAYEAQQMKIQHIEDFITTFRTEKKGAAQDRKVGQVLSRLKVLEKLERLPNPDDEKIVVFSLDFPEPSPLRQPLIANVKQMYFAYDKTKGGRERAEDEWLLNDVNVTVEMNSRIGILGPNGCGKSTLIKLLIGDLQPKDGVVWLNPSVSVAVFTQHHVDQLDLGLTPVELLRTLFPGTEIESCRRHLGRFGLGHDWSLIQIGNLSGGQKSRLAFAIMTWKNPHLIIMDEPTNHLDMETIDVLIDALQRFKGAVITVSHDQFYLSRTVKQYWAVGKGTVKVFDNLEECKKFSYK